MNSACSGLNAGRRKLPGVGVSVVMRWFTGGSGGANEDDSGRSRPWEEEMMVVSGVGVAVLWLG
jgi:hypothetical protein